MSNTHEGPRLNPYQVSQLITLAEIVAEMVDYDDEGTMGHWDGGLFYPELAEHVKLAREILHSINKRK